MSSTYLIRLPVALSTWLKSLYSESNFSPQTCHSQIDIIKLEKFEYKSDLAIPISAQTGRVGIFRFDRRQQLFVRLLRQRVQLDLLDLGTVAAAVIAIHHHLFRLLIAIL